MSYLSFGPRGEKGQPLGPIWGPVCGVQNPTADAKAPRPHLKKISWEIFHHQISRNRSKTLQNIVDLLSDLPNAWAFPKYEEKMSPMA